MTNRDDRYMQGSRDGRERSRSGNDQGYEQGHDDRFRDDRSYGMGRQDYGSGGWHDGANRDGDGRYGQGRSGGIEQDAGQYGGRDTGGGHIPNSYERGLGGTGSFNPEREMGPYSTTDRAYGSGRMSGRDSGGGYGAGDRDMGNLERDPQGRGALMRGSVGYGSNSQEQDGRGWQGQGRQGQERQGRSGQDGYGRTSGDSHGDRYGLGYGAGDRRGGYGDTFTQGTSAQGMTGRHYGRGPKNYQRSDERICEEINEHLTYHHDIDATDIDVQVQNGEVTLTGTVTDRRQKRLAEDCAEQVRGVRDVHNRIRVQQDGARGVQGYQRDTTSRDMSGRTGDRNTQDTQIIGTQTTDTSQTQGSMLSTTALSGGDSTNLTTSGTTLSSNIGPADDTGSMNENDNTGTSRNRKNK